MYNGIMFTLISYQYKVSIIFFFIYTIVYYITNLLLINHVLKITNYYQ